MLDNLYPQNFNHGNPGSMLNCEIYMPQKNSGYVVFEASTAYLKIYIASYFEFLFKSDAFYNNIYS